MSQINTKVQSEDKLNAKQKPNIAVVFGGNSSEIIVSEKSALGVKEFIDADKYNVYMLKIQGLNWDVLCNNDVYAVDKNDFSFTIDGNKVCFDFAYITIHGTPGEDGKLQGYLDLLQIPYSSSSLIASALSFNKFMCNTYLKGFGVKVAESIFLSSGMHYDVDQVLDLVSLPCFVKPNAGGSSFGISKVIENSELSSAIEKAFSESDEVIIEQFIEGTELTCGIYKSFGEIQVLPVTEVVPKNDFFDFEAKYNADKVSEITPARISDADTKRIKTLTAHIYNILSCKGIARVDYILSDGAIYLLEVNTTPGMTKTSFIPQQIEAAKLDIKEVFTSIIETELSKTIL